MFHMYVETWHSSELRETNTYVTALIVAYGSLEILSCFFCFVHIIIFREDQRHFIVHSTNHIQWFWKWSCSELE